MKGNKFTGLVILMVIIALAITGCSGGSSTPVNQGTDDLNAPTGLAAVAMDGKVYLSWEKVDGALSYNAYQASSSGGDYQLLDNTQNTYFLVSELTNGTEYYFVVSAVNNEGESEYSAEVSQTPTALISLSYEVMDFGVFAVGDSSGESYTIVNNSDETIYIVSEPVLTGDEDFSINYNGGTNIPSGDSAEIQVTFSPSSGGLKEAEISFSYNVLDSQEGSMAYSFKVQGTGNCWEFVGDEEFTPALDIGGQAQSDTEYLTLASFHDSLYLSFKNDEEDGQGNANMGVGLGKATVMYYDGTEWDYLGSTGISDEAAFWISMDIAADGTPYISYTDEDYDLGGATVKKYNGTEWVLVGDREFTKPSGDGTDSSPGNGAYSDIDVYDDGGTDVPYVAVQQKVDTLCQLVVYKYIEDSSEWVEVGATKLPDTIDPIIRVIEENSEPVPYVANVNGYVYKYTAANGWEAVGESVGFVTDMEVDNSSNERLLYISTKDGSDKVTVKKLEGSSWTDLGSPGFSEGTVDYVSLAVNNSGSVYTSFYDYCDPEDRGDDVVKVMEYTGNGDTGWEIVGNENITMNKFIFKTSLTINGETPYIAFQYPNSDTGDNNNGKGSVMEYQP